MKSSTTLLLILCLTTMLWGCNTQEQSNSDLTDISSQQPAQGQTTVLLWKEVAKNASGGIMHSTEYTYDTMGRKTTVTVAQGDTTTITSYTYDKNGFLAEEEMKTNTGSFIFHCIYENDINGNILKATTVDKAGNLLTETLNIYDENGKILEVKVDGKTTKVYSYEEDGSYTETYKNRSGYSKYDKNGNILEYNDDISETTYSYINSLLAESVTTVDDKVLKHVYEYKNDSVIRRTEYENDTITRVYLYEYDENMRLIKDSFQNEIGVTPRTTYYEYKEFYTENE